MPRTFQPPAVILSLRYDVFKLCTDRYAPFGTSTSWAETALSLALTDCRPHRSQTQYAIWVDTQFYTPYFSGALREQIDVVAVEGSSPMEDFRWTWQGQTYSTPGRRYYYATLVASPVNPNKKHREYAMAVEVGSSPHAPPADNLAEWAYGSGYTDPFLPGTDAMDLSLPYRLQRRIAQFGTAPRGMFAKTWLEAYSHALANEGLLSTEYWTMLRNDYTLVAFTLPDNYIP